MNIGTSTARLRHILGPDDHYADTSLDLRPVAQWQSVQRNRYTWHPADHTLGHLLQRMLSKQTAVEYLDSPFSAARGQQLQWLQREDWENGMPEDVQKTYLNNLQTSLKEWETTISKAQEHASAIDRTDPHQCLTFDRANRS